MDVVLSYDFPPKIGGAHHWLYEVYRRWPSPVCVLTAAYDEDAHEASRQRDFDKKDHGALTLFRAAEVREIDLLDLRSWRAFLSQAAYIGRFSDKRTTAVHALRAFPEGFAGLLYRASHPRSSRLITYAHGEEMLVAQTSRQLKWIAKAVYARSDLVVVNSVNTASMVKAHSPSAETVCIHPGVDTAAFVLPEADVCAFRDKLGWPADTVIVATVARMEPRKNQAMLIRAIAELRREGVPLAYVCAGDGEERPRLAEMARSLGLEDWVEFPGVVSDREKARILSAADIHAMPSIRHGSMIEGFGIVFIEAAAAGTPSIAGNVGGQSEAVLKGKTGLVIDGSSLPEVCSAIRSLALDPALRRRMGQEGKKWAATNDWASIVHRTRAAIGRVP